MAPKATIHHLVANISDVDRNIYESLDLRLARHPSESVRYLLTRTLAYCLSYAPGIAFSKGGLSSTDEPPVSIRDETGILLSFIDVGSPSAERLHKASKAARHVELYTHTDIALLRREAASRVIHRLEDIAVHHVEGSFLDELATHLAATTTWDLVRNDGQLYVGVSGITVEGALTRLSLVEPAPVEKR